MRSRILVLDPGKMTGWALYYVEEDVLQWGEGDFMTACRYTDGTAAGWGILLDLVSEEFKITIHTAKNTQQTWSLEVMGFARFCSQHYCGQDLIISPRPAAMNFSTDERLKALGWYVPGSPHARAAKRHLLSYLVKNGWWDDRLGSREMEETPIRQ